MHRLRDKPISKAGGMSHQPEGILSTTTVDKHIDSSVYVCVPYDRETVVSSGGSRGAEGLDQAPVHFGAPWRIVER